MDRAILELLPEQGNWNEEAYLWLTDRTNRLVEFTDGELEFLPMPTLKHQLILTFLFDLFRARVEPEGRVLFSTIRLRIREDKFREPDLVVFLDRKDSKIQNRFLHGADLVAEVVSEDDPKRDLIQKRKDYAEGQIPEYWIVNPLDGTITVLTLGKRRYRKHGAFRCGQKATSVLLPGLAVEVDSVMNVG